MPNLISHFRDRRLGCGLDGLEWSQVRTMLADVFADSGVAIDVYTP